MTMVEQVVRFGTAAALNGILTEPGDGREAPVAAPVILLNSGILHKVGACRLYVTLARRLAAAGVPTLRFDLSGLGDSDVRRDALGFEESAVAETREAMDHLATLRGWDTFQLAGLCSGADVAHMTAVVDARVMAMASIDARTHLTPGFWWHNYAPKLLAPGTWPELIRRRLARRAATATSDDTLPDEDAFELPAYVREIPPRDALAAELRILATRQVQMLYVFTDGLGFYNHEGQHRRAFRDVPFGSGMRECHLRGADHILTDPMHQQRTVDLHLEWARRTPLKPAVPALEQVNA
ncbi:MAG: hypothetical protein INH02_11670 [Gemmatimonas sp.]|uniref:hypothetical protein n=1 Tax=Gemmatimonas sp. TaxID=1962908 RepID=UPI0025C1BDAF|nr:hypothetical protein [Gemmatimonas sp.]MCA2988077.1 hypothetical protein [Gemmatimonas sp.]